jgi:hypothetical protein
MQQFDNLKTQAESTVGQKKSEAFGVIDQSVNEQKTKLNK